VSRVVLASRSGRVAEANQPLDDALRAAVARTAGAVTLCVERADAADRGAMRDLLGSHAEGLSAGGGVYHTAGVLDDGLLPGQTPQRLQGVMEPKAHAAVVLHELLDELGVRPSHVVFFSSVTSLVGTFGQTNYGAANAVLDALALLRRAAGKPALSVQWGPWDGFGMAMGERGKLQLWTPLNGEEGLAALGRALDAMGQQGVAPVCTIAALDVPGAQQLMRQHACLRPMFAGIVAPAACTTKAAAVSAGMAAPTGEDVLRAACALSGSDCLANFTPESSLVDLDLDSLGLAALAADLSRRFGVVVDVATLISANTCSDVALAIAALMPTPAVHEGWEDQQLDKCQERVTLVVTAESVLRTARTFASLDADANADTSLLDLDLDSLALAGLAAELSRQFGVLVDVAFDAVGQSRHSRTRRSACGVLASGTR
jgi:acyl carrier protein